MQFFMITSVLASVAVAFAMPGGDGSSGSGGNQSLCPIGLYSNPKCCSVDVLGVAAVGCATRMFSLQL